MNKMPVHLLAIGALAVAAPALADLIAIDTSNPANGLTDLYSATFDGGLIPCTAGSSAYCSFFGGDTPAGRAITFSPNATGVINAIPDGFIPAPAAGSFLDIALSNGNSTAQIVGYSTIALPALTLTIAHQAGPTVVNASGVGFVITPSGTASVNPDGQVEFLVDLAPEKAADFSDFSSIIGATNCTGPLCSLIPLLNFDMVRYRVFLDFDPTFTSFTGSFSGATNSGSRIEATLNSAPPVPVPAAAWLFVSGLGLLGSLARGRPAAL
ncbi:MAG: hypothetical protein R3F24_14150 [Gammaproteobacteria bacterium]